MSEELSMPIETAKERFERLFGTFTSKQLQIIEGAKKNDGRLVGYGYEDDNLIERGIIAYSESRGWILTPYGEYVPKELDELKKLTDETS